MQGKIIHQESWSRSVEGFPIEMYKKVHTPKSAFGTQRPFLFIGGVHGDEPEGVQLAQDLLQWIQSVSSQEDLWPWILIPCLNVEGFQAKHRTNSRGVDLNRNFPTQNWTPQPLKNRYYSGDMAGSEPEVQSLIQLIKSENPQVIVHFHSWEPCIVYTGAPGKKWAEMLSDGNKYEVKEDIGYPTPGSLGEWGWTENKIPVICIEEKESILLDLVWGHFQHGLQKMLRGQSA